MGPTVIQNKPLKPALQQSKYKASDAPDYFHLRGFERLTTSAPSTTGSASTCGSVSTTLSLNKQQEQQGRNFLTILVFYFQNPILKEMLDIN